MDSNELLVSILRSFRCYNQVEALGNLFDNSSYEELLPVINAAFGEDSEERSYLDSSFNMV